MFAPKQITLCKYIDYSRSFDMQIIFLSDEPDLRDKPIDFQRGLMFVRVISLSSFDTKMKMSLTSFPKNHTEFSVIFAKDKKMMSFL